MSIATDRQQAYIARGRRFRTRPLADLKTLFVAGYHTWVETFPRRDDSVDDVQAEFELRGEAVPFDLVEKEIEAIAALVNELSGFADAKSRAHLMLA